MTDDTRNGCPFPAGSAAHESWFEAIERQRLLAGFGRLVKDVVDSRARPRRIRHDSRRPPTDRFPRPADLACPACGRELHQLDPDGSLLCITCGWEGRTDEPDEP